MLRFLSRLKVPARGLPVRGPRLAVTILGVLTTVACVVAGLTWHDANAGKQRDRAGQEALASATAATQAIFSYDYRRFDASVANGRQFVTGSFATEYAETTASLKAAAEKEKAVVRAEVSAAGVVQAAAKRVEILLYVNQYRKNVNIDGEKVDQNRVVLTLVSDHGQWKVVAAKAI